MNYSCKYKNEYTHELFNIKGALKITFLNFAKNFTFKDDCQKSYFILKRYMRVRFQSVLIFNIKKIRS